MYSIEITKNKKIVYAIILAFLFNTSFLVILFFFELHHQTAILEPTFVENNLLLELLAETEPAQKENAAQEEAGLMMRGAENGTLPPSPCSDYNQQIETSQSIKQAVFNNTNTNGANLHDEETAFSPEIAAKQEEVTEHQQTGFTQETVNTFSEDAKATLIQQDRNAVDMHTIQKPTQLPEQPLINKQQRRKPKKSLAQMTQAALRTACSQGNAAIFSAGNKNKLPSELQLAEEQYWIKLERAFHNASISYQHLFPSNVSHQKKPIVSVIITYLPNGSINKVSIDRSSGDTLLDQAIITIFKEVQSMAPLLPAQLRQLYSNQRHCTIYH